MKMRKDELKSKIQYLIALIGFLFFIFILTVIFDQWIMPSYVREIEKVKVPNVIGIDYEKARQILEDYNLEYKIFLEQYNDEYPENVVINQTPKPNIYVKSGRQILLTISKGAIKVKMPYVVNMPLRQARLELMKNGVYISRINYVNNDSIGIDTVIAQSVSQGQSVNSKAEIILTVSKGPLANVKVPMLTGKTLKEVEDILSELGLELGTVTNTYDEIFEATFIRNTVVSQFPQAGEFVPKNSKIDITIFR